MRHWTEEETEALAQALGGVYRGRGFTRRIAKVMQMFPERTEKAIRIRAYRIEMMRQKEAAASAPIEMVRLFEDAPEARRDHGSTGAVYCPQLSSGMSSSAAWATR